MAVGSAYRPVPGFPGLEVTCDGRFRRNGRPKKASYCVKRYGNMKATVRIVWMEGGVSHYVSAARCVAKAWKHGFTDDDYIIYKDGDLHNIHADNLQVVDRERYYAYLRRNAGYSADSARERVRKLRNVIAEAGMTVRWLEEGDITPVNEHVREYLYPCLMEYCKETLHLGERTSMSVVPECLGRMYECIMSGMCLYNYERYCKKLLHNFKKKGNFGLAGMVPKPIQINVQRLNLDCLWERYKVQKLRKKEESSRGGR